MELLYVVLGNMARAESWALQHRIPADRVLSSRQISGPALHGRLVHVLLITDLRHVPANLTQDHLDKTVARITDHNRIAGATHGR